MTKYIDDIEFESVNIANQFLVYFPIHLRTFHLDFDHILFLTSYPKTGIQLDFNQSLTIYIP